MRRLAAIFGISAILTACGNADIVVKTDLDEKYIIKESAVTEIKFQWSEKISAVKKLIERSKDGLRENKKSVKDCSVGLSYDWCFDNYSTTRGLYQDDLEEGNSSLSFLKGLKAQEDDNTKIISLVRYRPIFVDINGDKNAQGYALATCLNPKEIGSEDSEKLFEVLGINADNTEKKKTAKESAYLSVTKKICDKYAFANTVFFNYTIDEDQDKDKKN